MIFFTSDSHFGHQNILSYCPNRKFSTIEDHDDHLIRVWNERVSDKDIIFHIGDFSFKNADFGISILKQLKGKKVLVAGNHDNRNLKNQEFCNQWRLICRGYHEIEVSFRGVDTLIVLCHYPLESFNKMRYGSFHLHGHSHTPAGKLKMQFMKNRKDIGVDSRLDHAPWEKDELLETILQENNFVNEEC